MRDHTRLEISYGRLQRNWERVQKLAPRAQILPMVKANAYGQGLVPVAKFFAENCAAKALGTATLGEAEELLKALPKFQGQVYVFSDTNLGFSGTRFEDPRLIPVVSTMENPKRGKTRKR